MTGQAINLQPHQTIFTTRPATFNKIWKCRTNQNFYNKSTKCSRCINNSLTPKTRAVIQKWCRTSVEKHFMFLSTKNKNSKTNGMSKIMNWVPAHPIICIISPELSQGSRMPI
jgi:hypothetical protein